MVNRNYQDTLAASKDFSSLACGLPYTDQLDVDDWCMPDRPTLPLTPPDTASDCALSDYRDMASSQWTPGFTSEDWCPGSTADDGSYTQPLGLDAFALFDATQGHIDAIPAWSSHTHGSVDTDMSPSLSYTSQSSRSLNTFSDSEHLWTTATTLPSSVSMVRHVSASSSQFVPLGHTSGTASMARTSSGMNYNQECYVNSVASAASRTGPFYDAQNQRDWLPTGQPLSRTYQDGQTFGTHAGLQYNRGSWPSHQLNAYPVDDSALFVGSFTPGVQASHRRAAGSSTIVRTAPTIEDPVAEDFRRLIDFPVEEQYQTEDLFASTHAPMLPGSFTQSWPVTTSAEAIKSGTDVLLPVPVDMMPSHSKTSVRRSSNYTTHGAEVDEGRYRTDPLYNSSPESDGLYHCPFAQDENCGHAPTKLKCNYDKFIDSHLKPFRCKAQECAKQAFSSTACLLRHEREAHGMHGHGKCPHLCPVPGCERSEPGRGFPRLYNCKDHQRRAHGIITSPTSSSAHVAAPPLSQQTVKAGEQRKRKASPTEKAVSRRHKPEPMGEKHYVVQPAPEVRYASNMETHGSARHQPRRLPSRFSGY